ncbi:hypothetical protein PHYC_03259 [Phycisphaerales bacterium]|nr:hypothetical protein PHYC_03259 [Phycisphaerales bacterium]
MIESRTDLRTRGKPNWYTRNFTGRNAAGFQVNFVDGANDALPAPSVPESDR